jgi:acetyltransferase-like isoleucine patch superfamily enzyme
MFTGQTRFPIRQMITWGLLPTPLKVAYYRSRGAKIGSRVSMGLGSVIVADEIEIGEGVAIGFGSYLRARKIRIGRFARIGSASFLDAETIEIGEDAKISEQVFVGGLSSPQSHFHLGARTTVMQHTFINVARPVTIGDDTGIGGKCTIFTHGSWQNMLDGYPVSFAPVSIGNNVWIPWQVFIMPGVTIGDGATIGASSLVTRDIPAGALAVGSPAKVMRNADQYPTKLDRSQQAEMLRQIIIEFCEYLGHSGLKVSRDQQSGSDIIAAVDEAGRSHGLVVCYDAIVESVSTTTANVVLSLTEIADCDRQRMEDRHQMWLDIGVKKRGGESEPFGEELVEFIKRYGVRFARAG